MYRLPFINLFRRILYPVHHIKWKARLLRGGKWGLIRADIPSVGTVNTCIAIHLILSLDFLRLQIKCIWFVCVHACQCRHSNVPVYTWHEHIYSTTSEWGSCLTNKPWTDTWFLSLLPETYTASCQHGHISWDSSHCMGRRMFSHPSRIHASVTLVLIIMRRRRWKRR